MMPANNPYGGVNPLIDKMIGNAYDIVKYVARYLKEIRYCAENMESIYTAANGNKMVLTGTASGSSLELPLPVGFDFTSIEGMVVTAFVTESGNEIYMPGSDTFNFGCDGVSVIISITEDVPALQTAEYKCLIHYSPTE